MSNVTIDLAQLDTSLSVMEAIRISMIRLTGVKVRHPLKITSWPSRKFRWRTSRFASTYNLIYVTLINSTYKRNYAGQGCQVTASNLKLYAQAKLRSIDSEQSLFTEYRQPKWWKTAYAELDDSAIPQVHSLFVSSLVSSDVVSTRRKIYFSFGRTWWAPGMNYVNVLIVFNKCQLSLLFTGDFTLETQFYLSLQFDSYSIFVRPKKMHLICYVRLLLWK